MKIKDFLRNFRGKNHIKIYDRYDFSTHRYNESQSAINEYGYYTVRSWTIEENVLVIIIQSQF